MTTAEWGEMLISAGAVGIAGTAGWLDWRARRIPNWLTVPSLFVGLALGAIVGRWPGLKGSMEGAGLSLALLLPFVLLRGLGAGDWKLMGALGAFLGPYRTIVVLLGTVFIAGAMSLIEVIRQRKVRQTLSNMVLLLVSITTFRIGYARTITLDNPGLLKIPFGVAAAFSTVLFFLLVAALRFLH
jgi:prepilin peptidase CpaA